MSSVGDNLCERKRQLMYIGSTGAALTACVRVKTCCVACPSLRTRSSVDEYSSFSPGYFPLRRSQVPADTFCIIVNV